MQSAQPSRLSQQLYDRALLRIPGGVNSPVRSFKAVGKSPLFAARGEGSTLWDVDGNAFIDYVMSYGPLIFGHAPAEVTSAIKAAANLGTTYGASTAGEVELAELICEMAPSMEKVRLVNSGTEAVMSAIRLARGFTGRDMIVKFEGCYHGHSDGLLAKAGSGVATLAIPDSSGVPANLTRDTIVLPYNDIKAVAGVMRTSGVGVAAVIVEPVAANMGVVAPQSGFLEALRETTASSGSLLIFDEIITGFRLAPGGAQELFGITPDLTTVGKIAGGGLPLAAYGGRADIMDHVAPVGAVYQAGTLSGNPLAVAAGLAVLRRLRADSSVFRRLDTSMTHFMSAVKESADRAGIAVRINQVGSISTIFFTDDPVTDFASAMASNRGRYSEFFGRVYDQGVLLAPSQFEAMFLSTAHTGSNIDRTLQIMGAALAQLAN